MSVSVKHGGKAMNFNYAAAQFYFGYYYFFGDKR